MVLWIPQYNLHLIYYLVIQKDWIVIQTYNQINMEKVD